MAAEPLPAAVTDGAVLAAVVSGLLGSVVAEAAGTAGAVATVDAADVPAAFRFGNKICAPTCMRSGSPPGNCA